MIFEFKLILKKEYSSQAEISIPDPTDVISSITKHVDINYHRYNSLVRAMHLIPPSFYIPNQSIENGELVLEEPVFYVYLSSSFSNPDLEAAEEASFKVTRFAGFTCVPRFIADPKEYQAAKKKLNCFTFKDGEERSFFDKPVYYMLNKDLPKPVVTTNLPQRLTLAVSSDTALPNTDSLRVLNTFHKYLVASFPFNHQARGSWMDQPIPQKEQISYRTHSNGDNIEEISISCESGITDELIDHFQAHENVFHVNAEQMPVTVTCKSLENYELNLAERYRTVSHAYPISKYFKQQINKSIEMSFFQNILTTLGYDEELKGKVVRKGDFMVASTNCLGGIMIRVTHLEDASIQHATRGSRSAEIPVHLEIFFERPVSLSAIGKHRRFGAGILEPF